ncbi:MAG: response regulator [Deltaproteobacteria bacterium]|nr:response regulator [Deltaproteobacteria bacterium]
MGIETGESLSNMETFEQDKNSETRPEARPFRIDRDFYTSGQAARLLGIPDRTIRRYLTIGKIAGTQHPITGTWQISRAALASFVEANGCDVVQTSREMHVFLVNDEPAMVGFLERALQRALQEATITTLNDACNALIQIGSVRPDLVVLKARMPILYGRDLVMAIRSNRETASIKILAMSGLPDDLEELTALGTNETLATPFTYQDLVGKLGGMFPDRVELPKES